MQHLVNKITIEGIGAVTVSTVNLAHTTPTWAGFETCLFWGRESEVVESYGTWTKATRGHHGVWSNPVQVAAAIQAVTGRASQTVEAHAPKPY